MKKLFTLFSIICLFQTISGQNGAPLLTHFGRNSDIEDQSWAICQDRNKIMLFANRKGILSFDGEDWSQYRFPITPFAMKMNPSDKRVYIGGENNYGVIDRDLKGIYRYESLSGDSADLGMITKIVFSDSLIWFCGERSISCHDFRTGNLVKRFRSEQPLTGMFLSGKNTFINVAGKGLHRVESDTLFPIVTGYLTEKLEILFRLPYNEKMVLLGMSNSKLSLFDGIKYYDYGIQDNGYIANNVLSEGIAIGDSLYAFSTIGGGAVIVERATGRVKNIINNQQGLPDDEIFAIGNDECGGLWLSHPFGLTRADLSLPVGNFSIYPGLKGNLTAALKYNNELYVATSEGVFWLAHEKSYSEIEIMREENVPGKVSIIHQPQLESTTALVAPKEQQNARKSIFSRIFGKKNTQSQQGEKVKPVSDAGIAAVQELPQTRLRKETIRKLKSIDYVFRKIPGLNDKCRQLVPTKNGLLAATNRGLFVITNHYAVSVSGDRYINYIGWTNQNEEWPVAAADGYFVTKLRNGKWITETPDPAFTDPVYSVIMQGKTFWLGCENSAFRVVNDGGVKYDRFNIGSEFSQRYNVKSINDSIFLFTETGIHVYNEQSSKFIPYPHLSGAYNEFAFPVSNIPLIGTGKGWIYPERSEAVNARDLCLLKLFDDIVSVYCENGNIWVVDRQNSLYGIDRKRSIPSKEGIALFVKQVKNEKGTSFDLSKVVFDRGDNIIYFDIVAPAYFRKNVTEYQYYIDKVMSDWSQWSTQTSYSMGITKPGEYLLKIRARDIWGEVGETVSIPFVIKAPFTQTTIFYLLVIIFFMAVLLMVVRFRERQLQETNRVLEEKVMERTAQIEAQKEEITSSIAYASRIQMAMLPVPDLFTETFDEYFIIFKPRDIVSGDFYWIGENKGRVFLTVADCTGHGVPGAFMSTLGISALNEIVTNNQNLNANIVLNLLREKIKTSLHQTGKEGEAADGMDISLCAIDKHKKKIQYAGAFNPMYFSRNGELTEYKADRMPIGIHYGDEPSFTNHEINCAKGDIIYLLSDGLTDQFGGPEGSKFKKAQLKKLLADIHFFPLSEQKMMIEKELMHWKGRFEQVDDITFIGVKL
ncbi:MAG TPA: SpoIIE family protein phosphatase [Bacteroidales bacterium]|nr:SpoIIE family protein phosphatase [Bacteroidales bacterium]